MLILMNPNFSYRSQASSRNKYRNPVYSRSFFTPRMQVHWLTSFLIATHQEVCGIPSL